MRPPNLKTKIFLDSGNPDETREIIKLLGFLDGQTTNPTLISKNPASQKLLQMGKKFSSREIFDFYRKIVKELSFLMPNGSISIEVYADSKTTAEEMLEQGRKMFKWIPNAHIKYPITNAGLEAANQSVREGLRVNMTLCFNQKQAAAVYAATIGAKKGDIYISPFVGRLDDIGINGMDLIKNTIRMYKNSDGHINILTASARNIDHFLYALKLGSDIITAPFAVLKQWAETGMRLPGNDFNYTPINLLPIQYQNLDLRQDWRKFDISDQLTDKGIEKFSQDWNNLLITV